MSSASKLDQWYEGAQDWLRDSQVCLVLLGRGVGRSEDQMTSWTPERLESDKRARALRVTHRQVWDAGSATGNPEVFYGFWGASVNQSAHKRSESGSQNSMSTWEAVGTLLERFQERSQRHTQEGGGKHPLEQAGVRVAPGGNRDTPRVTNWSCSADESQEDKEDEESLTLQDCFVVTSLLDTTPLTPYGVTDKRVYRLDGNQREWVCSMQCSDNVYRLASGYRFHVDNETFFAPKSGPQKPTGAVGEDRDDAMEDVEGKEGEEQAVEETPNHTPPGYHPVLRPHGDMEETTRGGDTMSQDEGEEEEDAEGEDETPVRRNLNASFDASQMEVAIDVDTRGRPDAIEEEEEDGDTEKRNWPMCPACGELLLPNVRLEGHAGMQEDVDGWKAFVQWQVEVLGWAVQQREAGVQVSIVEVGALDDEHHLRVISETVLMEAPNSRLIRITEESPANGNLGQRTMSLKTTGYAKSLARLLQ